MNNHTGILPTRTRSSLRAAGKTLNLAALSMFPYATRLRHIDVREWRSGNVTVRSYTSDRSGFPLVVLHGLTGEGCSDSRLVGFCKMLAAVGLCVYTPNLQGLCMMDPEPTDIDSITALLKALVNEHKSQIGLMGFSFGGTYALLAAASPETAGAIRFVLAVGAYYSLADVVEHTFSVRGKRDHSTEGAYALLALDWKYRTMLSLPEGETAALEELMDRSCSGEMHFTREDTSLVAKIMSLQQQEDIYREWKNRLPEISSLNIEGNPTLGSIEAPVFLLHNELDTTVPAEQSCHIAAELARLQKNVVSHIGRSGEHVTFSIRDDAGLARFFYRIMLLTELRNTGTPERNGRRGATAP
jgi:pimeloyl-ACP methyl ester carboxylesterase